MNKLTLPHTIKIQRIVSQKNHKISRLKMRKSKWNKISLVGIVNCNNKIYSLNNISLSSQRNITRMRIETIIS